MSSLQFLNKKSWHVGTKKNEEQVWLREQAASKEAARIAELQKQLAEERKLEEVQRLERESGNSTVPPRAPRVDWMYEGPGAATPGTAEAAKSAEAQKEKDREDTLLGKKEAFIPGVPAEMSKQSSEEAQVVDDASIRMELTIRDAEAKLREDPLLLIRKRHVEELDRAQSVHGGKALHSSKQGAVLRRLNSQPACMPRLSAARPPRNTNDELRRAEKKARKEYRARIRVQRQLRREQKTEDSQMIGRKRPRSPKSPEPSLRLQAVGSDDVQPESTKHHDAKKNVRVANALGPTEHGDGYGLSIPARGTKVAVQKGFEPRVVTNLEKAPEEARQSSRPRRTLSVSQRSKRLAAMEMDANELNEERADRFREQIREERVTEQSRGDGSKLGAPDFIRDFSRDALDRASHFGRARR